MKFNDYNISDEIKRTLNKLDFKRPTDIQFKSIPSILKGEDVLAIAQTGTGKTAAFAIPIINKIFNITRSKRPDGIKCLIMVPTRELAKQIEQVFKSIGKYTNVRPFALIGGVEQDPQIDALNSGVDVLIATPGRMYDMIAQGHLHLSRVQTLILDEADQMLALGFYKDIQGIQNRLPGSRQTLFFSATINEEIKKLAYTLVKNAIRIQISPKDAVSKNVTHFVAPVEMDDKRYFLEHFIKEHPENKMIVFVRTKVRAERVLKAMERVGVACVNMHSGKEQEERNEAMRAFKSGDVSVLVATDISARGVDIPNVDYVINYDLPDVPENYVHRIGRTGRGVNKGEAFAFCAPEEMPFLIEIEKLLGKRITQIEFSKKEYSDVKTFSDERNLKDLIGDIEFELDQAGVKKRSKKKKKK
tara:strand:- start:24 stop:1271 length:1248 start_codon:yes stop_codon:yes gene_type:complete